MKNTDKTMDKIVALCKGRGFIFAGSEIYGGLANTWDYGPLGVELKNNIKKAWWKKFVQENPYNVGLDVYKRQAGSEPLCPGRHPGRGLQHWHRIGQTLPQYPGRCLCCLR